METLLQRVSIQINNYVYLKDPETSDLGQKIVSGSIDLLAELGFEAFTFKKLAADIGTTEASIYRYFESKHKLLLYLTSWYWGWMEYRLMFTTANVADPQDRLLRAITLLTEEVTEDRQFQHINEKKLHQIVIAESSKAYLTKVVDEENKFGAFLSYKQLVERVSKIIVEINPSFKYPHMLISTIVEGSHHQRYFAAHLPRLTDVVEGEDAIVEFYKLLVLKTIAD